MLRSRNILLFFICLLAGHYLGAQVLVSGRVYDISKLNPLEAVTVQSTSGTGTITDSTGHYSIIANENDSIWFSYLNKPTPKYPVRTILNKQNFEISLHVNATELKEVRVSPRNYRMDSIANREEYAKAFNFQKPSIGSSLDLSNGSVGLDLDQFIDMFKFRRNRRMIAFRNQLLEEEEQKYIDHRFNRALIIKLTQLRGPALDTFVVQYRPTIDFVENATDYELQDYIKKSFSHYQMYINMRRELEGK